MSHNNMKDKKKNKTKKDEQKKIAERHFVIHMNAFYVFLFCFYLFY